MTVYLVGAGPGDPELLTVRAAALLASADVVLYDRLAGVRAILDLAPPDAIVESVGKQGGRPSTPQERINGLLVEYGRQYGVVVRLKGGDPFVFGRGGEEALACRDAGLDVVVVPGITSAVAAPAAAGIPVTHRGASHAVTVVPGRTAPGTPEVDWPAIAAVGGTIVVLMAGQVLSEIAQHLQDAGVASSTPVAVICEGTRPSQLTHRTTLSELAGIRDLPSSPTIVIGAVAGLDVTS